MILRRKAARALWWPALVALSGLLIACGHRESTAQTSSPTHPGWLVLSVDDTLRIEYEAVGVEWRNGRAALWLGFVSVRDERARVIAPPFWRFETRQDVNCMMRIARGLEIRTPDSTGTLHVHTVRDTSWQLFADHPLGRRLLDNLCTATGHSWAAR